MKKIEVLARTLEYEKKQLGRGGEYVVSDVFAAQMQAEGKAKIIEDLSTDNVMTSDAVDHEFLTKFRHHLPQIMDMLETEFKKKMEAEREEHLGREKEFETTNKSDEENESDETGTESNSSVAVAGLNRNNENDSNNTPKSDIPDKFPGKAQLIEKGITTMVMLKELSYDQLVEKGITTRTANQIGTALAELESK